jgi:hypothetical protein
MSDARRGSEAMSQGRAERVGSSIRYDLHSSPHLTSPLSSCLISPHLILTSSPHLTSPHLTHLHFSSTFFLPFFSVSPHPSSPHLTSPHSPHLSPHLTSLI